MGVKVALEMTTRGNVPEGKVHRSYYLRVNTEEAIRRAVFERRAKSASELVDTAVRQYLGLNKEVQGRMQTIRQMERDGNANSWAQYAWEGWVGSQTPREFLEISRQQGKATPAEAVEAYVGELSEDQDVPEDLEEHLLRYIRQHVEWCEICSGHGQETPATRYGAGRNLCDECAAEYDSYLDPGERLEDVDREEMDRRVGAGEVRR